NGIGLPCAPPSNTGLTWVVTGTSSTSPRSRVFVRFIRNVTALSSGDTRPQTDIVTTRPTGLSRGTTTTLPFMFPASTPVTKDGGARLLPDQLRGHRLGGVRGGDVPQPVDRRGRGGRRRRRGRP